MSGFAALAAQYHERSIVQASAGQRLIELLDPAANSAILDVGCGTGNLTAALQALTSNRVVGLDPSAEMISQARQRYGDQGITFSIAASEELAFQAEFDALFCNSALQWFRHPAQSLNLFFQALRPGGKLALQAPATQEYCPNFVAAFEQCRGLPELAAILATFQSPWFFLETARAYQELVEQAGFLVEQCWIEEQVQPCTLQTAVEVFLSGAAAGYLNKACYGTALLPGFNEKLLQGIQAALAAQADNSGMVTLRFRRVFVLACKGAA